jgi:hypothetical protein
MEHQHFKVQGISFLKDRESDFFTKISIKDDYLKCPFIQRKGSFSNFIGKTPSSNFLGLIQPRLPPPPWGFYKIVKADGGFP